MLCVLCCGICLRLLFVFCCSISVLFCVVLGLFVDFVGVVLCFWAGLCLGVLVFCSVVGCLCVFCGLCCVVVFWLLWFLFCLVGLIWVV